MEEPVEEGAAAPPPPESPKPLAFTIDFGGEREVDTQRQKALAEKFQKRHKRVQSLSKLDTPTPTPIKTPSTGNLPRKSSFQSSDGGYLSSEERPKRSDLTLFLKNVTTDRMTQSFPNVLVTPDEQVQLRDVSSPELDLVSPFSPLEEGTKETTYTEQELAALYVKSPGKDSAIENFEIELDKSDTASDTGTYTLDPDNYSEEQKARMSIDREFKIEQVSIKKKTEEYVNSLVCSDVPKIETQHPQLKSPRTCARKLAPPTAKTKKQLSPIMSPTQHLSITDTMEETLNNVETAQNRAFLKILFPSPVAKREGLADLQDQGAVISVTSSGAFKPKTEREQRRLSLTKSEIQVQAFVDNKSYTEVVHEPKDVGKRTPVTLTANIVNVQSIAVATLSPGSPSRNLPPTGKSSPTKIPSPVHTLTQPPRNRTSLSSSNLEYIDNGFDTDLILRPTQNFINSLQQRLSLDSDPDSDYDIKCGLQLNNTAHLLKQKASHTRHNSLDDRAMNISNKLEHFQNKNLQGIDQTYTNLFNRYASQKKVQNSPNNSPIKRSTSFSNKNLPKNTNILLPQKEVNVCNSPNIARRSTNSIQRSSSTASIKPNYIARRANGPPHQKIDRGQFGDTESSSEEDFEKNLQKRKDLSSITNTRCNKTFSLRRARVDNELAAQLRCPNTPELRRRTSTDPKHQEQRAISVDRKPLMRTNDVQSRYLLNVTKRSTPPPPSSSSAPPSAKPSAEGRVQSVATPPKTGSRQQQVFARTDSGRVSVRSTKPTTTNSVTTTKGFKKDGSGKKQGGARSNSSLSSREVEFQNWKRRKSYDPMKAAAEGKKKEMAKRQGLGHNPMTQSYTEANHSQDSSPSHSSSVHRSQSFHGTAALEQLLSSEEEEDLTLSADEGFSPPTPSPCELSPTRSTLRQQAFWDRIRH